MKQREIYVSVDIEADGPIPGDNSMMSIGAVLYNADGEQLSYFMANLMPLHGAKQDDKVMEWWDTQPEAFEATQTARMDPANAMRHMAEWVGRFSGRPVFVGYPAAFDFMFVHWYMMHFVGHDPFGHQALDLKTYAMARMGTPFKGTVKGEMPKSWFVQGEKHTHVALEDAKSQGRLFFKIRESLELKVGRSDNVR